MTNSIRRRRARKTKSRHSLTLRTDGRWCKKGPDGRMHYFGRDEQKALDLWEKQRDAIMAGKDPEPDTLDGADVTLGELTSRFVSFKDQLVTEGTLEQRTRDEYFATCERLVRLFGKSKPAASFKPADFMKIRGDISASWGLFRLQNEMVRTRSIFKFALDEELIDRPVNFGQGFKPPKAAAIEKHRNSRPQMFEADEIRAMLDEAPAQLRCMILLGTNAAFGNDDCASLTVDAIDLTSGWVSFPRGKTGRPRKCKLWPETQAAIETVLAERSKNTPHPTLFVTKYARPWNTSAIAHEFVKLARRLELNKDGLGFYGLRHSHRTIAGGAGDIEACDIIMGHAPQGVAARHYNAHIVRGRVVMDESRLARVADHVRSWLFPEPKAKHKTSQTRSIAGRVG